MSANEKQTGYLIPHTHWDREWRYPIWKNRMLLIDFMDVLLNILDTDPEYQCFLLDGQSVPIEDYLEVAPQHQDKVQQYIEKGKIAIGPWYTLPDLYPVDGECLVRNLLRGIRLSQKFGGHLKIGYNSFGWGQTAQFPQIYKEFGFDFIIAAKKVSEKRAPESEFMWESPDGTQVLTSRLGNFARANFFFNAYIKIRYGIAYFDDNFKYSPQNAGLACHSANPEEQDDDYFLIEPRNSYYPEYLLEGIETAWKGTDDTVMKDHRLLLNGCDFSSPQPDLTKLIRDANKILKDKKLVTCRPEVYAEKLKEFSKSAKFRVIQGELRDGPACDCSGNALSSRIYIKQLNKKAQNAMIRKAEPLASVLGMMGKAYPSALFDIAWKHMLHSHAHDSINGVTQDKTADDVVYRLNQALEIGKVVFEKSTGDVIKMIDLSSYDMEDMLLVVFNSLPYSVSDVIKVCIDTPQDKKIWSFEAVDCDGKKVAVQHVSRQEKAVPVHDMDTRPWPHYIDRHICYMDCGMIPAAGYKVFKIVPKTEFKRNWFYPIEMRKVAEPLISCAPNQMENEHLAVTIAPNGTLTIKDKNTNVVFSDLHYFEDTGDVGNYWSYYPPYDNKTYNSLGTAAKIWCEDNGPLTATYGIETIMSVPASGSEPMYGIRGESCRSQEMAPVTITSWITLKRGSRRVDIKTKVHNTAKNHRLRVVLPTGIKTDSAYASGHFMVDKRPAAPVCSTTGEYYPEMQTLPMQHFVDVSDGKTGLAVVHNSLLEYELTNDDRSHLYLTLFRSVGTMIVTGWRCVPFFSRQQGNYLLRDLNYEYSIYPHQGDFARGSVYEQAEKLNVPLSPIQTCAHKLGHLPQTMSFFSITPANLIMSAFKKAEERDAYILRVFNPLETAIEGKIKMYVPIKKAYVLNLNEKRIGDLAVSGDNTISVKAEHHKIVTLEFVV
jgi:mannosylglycerate hydrolase